MYLWLCNRPMPRLVGAHWPGSFASILNFIDSPYSFPSEVEEEGREASYRNDQNPADNVLWGKNDETASLRAEVRELRPVGAALLVIWSAWVVVWQHAPEVLPGEGEVDVEHVARRPHHR